MDVFTIRLYHFVFNYQFIKSFLRLSLFTSFFNHFIIFIKLIYKAVDRTNDRFFYFLYWLCFLENFWWRHLFFSFFFILRLSTSINILLFIIKFIIN
jgi:hypothetical protein